MDRRCQVFLSSTYEDLKEERLEVMKALLELGCIPAGMEYFPAGDEEAWKYVTDLIDECDYYLVVVAGRYGTTDSEGISFTEREYRYAMDRGVPVAAFLHSDPSAIPSGKCETDPNLIKRLEAFRELCRRRLCKEWSTPHELGAVVSRSLTQLIRRHRRPGWVRATGLAPEDAARQILELRDIVEEQDKQLARLVPPEGTEEFARGSDPVSLDVRLTFTRRGSSWTDSDHSTRPWVTIDTSWDELFTLVAPSATDWTRESTVRAALIRGLKNKAAPSTDGDYPDHEMTGATISAETFKTVMVQFLALGLFESKYE